jgi:hypothetical protein
VYISLIRRWSASVMSLTGKAERALSGHFMLGLMLINKKEICTEYRTE